MKSRDAEPIDPSGLIALQEAKRVFDASWLTTVVTLALATFLGWYFRFLDVDFTTLAKIFLGYGLFHVGVAAVLERFKSPRTIRSGMVALETTGLLFLGFAWLAVGGLQTPTYLIVFVIPIVTSAVLLPRRSVYIPCLSVVLVVLVAALWSDPSTRWVSSYLGLAEWLLPQALPALLAEAGPSTAPRSSTALSLGVFALVLFATATVAASLSDLVRRLHTRLGSSALATQEAEQLSSSILRAARLPSAVVHQETGQIAEASESFLDHFGCDPGQFKNERLTDLIDFRTVDAIQALVSGKIDELPFCSYSLHGENRSCRLLGYTVSHNRESYTFLTLEDFTELFYLERTLDVLDEGYVLVGPDHRVRYANQSAIDLLHGIEPGVEASTALDIIGAPQGWWNPAPHPHRDRHIEIGGQGFEARLSSVGLADFPGRFVALSLRADEARV